MRIIVISTLYKIFQDWTCKGSVYLIGDLHFEDKCCKEIDINWPLPMEQISLINRIVGNNDTFICLGDVGNPSFVSKINGYKVLITGNHDRGKSNYDMFNEVYDGPLFISKKIVLSHEPIDVEFALNIHGHQHNDVYYDKNKPNSLNLAANVVDYKPHSLQSIINTGYLSKIDDIHKIYREERKKEIAEKGDN